MLYVSNIQRQEKLKYGDIPGFCVVHTTSADYLPGDDRWTMSRYLNIDLNFYRFIYLRNIILTDYSWFIFVKTVLITSFVKPAVYPPPPCMP